MGACATCKTVSVQAVQIVGNVQKFHKLLETRADSYYASHILEIKSIVKAEMMILKMQESDLF